MAKRSNKKQDKNKSEPDSIDTDDIDRFLEEPGDAPAETPQGGPKPSATPVQSPSGDEDIPEETEDDSGETSDANQESQEDLALDISDDGLKATVRSIYPDTKIEDVMDLLKRNKVTENISEAAIRKAIETAQESEQAVNDLVVATGVPPKPPSPSRIKHCPPEGIEALPALSPISSLLELKDREEVRPDSSISAWLVGPGDCLAVKVVDEGKPGTGVQGQTIQPSPQEDGGSSGLQAGSGVELASNGVDYLSRTFGYGGVLDGLVSVVPPIWIAADGLEACFLNIPPIPGSKSISPDHLRSGLTASGVSIGVDEGAIAEVCEGMDKGTLKETLIPLASGVPPEQPQDAAANFSFPYQSRAGAILPDGSIDFKERNLFPAVEKDALLVETTQPVAGKPGKTVKGEDITLSEPAEVELIAGDNVRQEKQGGNEKLFSEMEGGASVQVAEIPTKGKPLMRYTVSVRPIAQVPGDVGYGTGNIDFRGNIEIRGSITRGFRVSATGDVSVSETVEAGAEVKSGGSVTVGQGIIGNETRIEASGSVTAKFVHDARIEAGGDVVIGSYVHSAYVRSGGCVQVEGRGAGTSGGIVGGETWGILGITSRNVGSSRETATLVAVGVDPDLYAGLEKAAQAARYAGTLLKNLLKALGLKALKTEEIRELIARKPNLKNKILHYVKKANQLAEVMEKQEQEQKKIRGQIEQAAKGACLDVQDTAYGGVRLRIGGEEVLHQDSLKGVRFHLDSTGEKPSIVWADQSSAEA